MRVKERFPKILHQWELNRYVMYAQIRCDVLSTCASKLEAIFKTAGVEFVRLLEPDSDTLASYTGRLYSGKSLEIIELTDGMSRMFYLASSQVPVRPEGTLEPEFTIFFNVRSEEALEALLRVIGEKKISGRRYRYRSRINLAMSFIGSFLLSSLLNVENYFLQSLILLALALLIYLILDYPFSLLYIRGVEVLSHDPWERNTIRFVKVWRIKTKHGKEA
ncbi:hypothetical protein [Palaeococcus ferrophilus]|uniref:hypothetical protein n=1 Tax=Palaeococcus ferrophilus TaxID=83868 RepID=UPI0012F7D75B|nr:hypothetical protein [Palaeococcus ferrophilus]